MKPKTNRKGSTKESSDFDRCQTPVYALDPILEYLKSGWTVWEPASGEGGLIEPLAKKCVSVISSDILFGKNFFRCDPFFDDNVDWDAIVTNPPYSIKYEWIERCYHFEKPFALLMPLETLGAARAQKMFQKHGMELVLLNRRVNFKMPNKGYSGKGAQFPVAWFTHGLEIGYEITYAKISHRHDAQMSLELA